MSGLLARRKILLATTILGSWISPAAAAQCVVDLDVRSVEAGRTAEDVEVSAKTLGPQTTVEWAPTDAGHYRLRGPCTYYEVRVQAPGHCTANLIVPAFSERNRMRVDLVVGQVVSEPLKTIKGRVFGAGIEKRNLWVKFVKTRGSDSIGAQLPLLSSVIVDESGAFEISGVRGGEYVALVFEDRLDAFGGLEPTLLAAEPFSIERGGPQELREMELVIALED